MTSQTIDVYGYWTVKVFYNVYTGQHNTGFTYTNVNKKTSVVVIGTATSIKQFLNTIVHEAKHVQSVICEYYNINEQSEDAAYLIGWLVMVMYDRFKQFIK